MLIYLIVIVVAVICFLVYCILFSGSFSRDVESFVEKRDEKSFLVIKSCLKNSLDTTTEFLVAIDKGGGSGVRSVFKNHQTIVAHSSNLDECLRRYEEAV
ncbi:hypothetical protein ACFL16_03655 [Patescibacteria group bacterium]